MHRRVKAAHRFAPHATVGLARDPRAARAFYAMWLMTGVAIALMFGLSSRQPVLSKALTSLSWLATGAWMCWQLRTDALATAQLRHAMGHWTLHWPLSTDQAELPCEITLCWDVQRIVLLRLKAQHSWHWVWLSNWSLTQPVRLSTTANQVFADLNTNATNWLTLRRALAASKR